ncbi:MAG: hypothetical protein IIC24_00905 [Chloroflexi bacterium]|nr:hypothetical protein [Chloroflexota bacterium]
MELVWIALISFAAFIGVAVVVVGGVVLFLRIRAREPIKIDLRFLVRLYLLVVIVAGLLLFTQGASKLMQAGFATVGDKQFSYRPVYVNLPTDSELRTQSALELKERSLLTDAELEQLSILQTERQRKQRELDEERRRLGLDRALKEGLILGITFLVIGLAIWSSHLAGRRWLETQEERESLLNRLYLIVVTITFGVITIVYLPQAVSEALSYALLDPFDRGEQPGEKLALSITSLPIWLIYLWEAIRAMRRIPPRSSQPRDK